MFFTAIIKPVNGKCNLGCEYCYFDSSHNDQIQNTMSYKTLEKTISFFCTNQNNIEFIWHGGEPLIAGLDFYKKVIELQEKFRKNGILIKNCIQTNATLIDDMWAKFFEKNNFSVGVSIDGPKHIHDKFRHYKNGVGSFEKTLNGIKTLQSHNIDVSVICCVNLFSISSPNEIFNFFINNNIKNIKFSRVRSFNNSFKSSITQKEFTDFLLSIFNSWVLLDDNTIVLRDIESIINMILGGNQRECIFSSKCHKYLTIYANGDIYPCDCISKEKQYLFGNINVDDCKEMLKNNNFINLKKLLYKKEFYCKQCEYRKICRGGCFLDWYKDDNNIYKNKSCEDLIYMFKSFYKELQKYGLV